jgi:lactate dehydrogenase-like 2-hydroxyacid dehydrogenase
MLLLSDHPGNNEARKLGAKFLDIYTLLKESDVISLLAPLTSETEL